MKGNLSFRQFKFTFTQTVPALPRLNVYTYAPNIYAIQQSSNLYSYCLNNPVRFHDSSGEFVVTTLVICAVVGAVAGAVAGGVAGHQISVSRNVIPSERWKYIAGGAAIGAVGGGALGAAATPVVISVTGVGAVAITSTGVTTITASTGAVGAFGYQFGDATLKAASTVRDALLSTAQNPQLRNLIDQLYRPGAYTGDGGTSMALINEWIYGATKLTATHYQKATDMIKALNNLYMDYGSVMSYDDLEIAFKLLNDLKEAVKLF